MADSKVVTLRFSTTDLELLRQAASRRRQTLSAFVRQIVLENYTRTPAVQEVLDALEEDLHLRLRFRALISNPAEG